MKPFNLEAALNGAKVVTRDGREVKIAGYNPDALPRYSILFWDTEGIGRNATVEGKVGEIDQLSMAPTERKEWIVRLSYDYPLSESYIGPFTTAEKAKQKCSEYSSGATIHELTIIE
jgi:hypothetical protein